MAYIEIDLVNNTERKENVEEDNEEEKEPRLPPQPQLLKQVININGDIVPAPH